MWRVVKALSGMQGINFARSWSVYMVNHRLGIRLSAKMISCGWRFIHRS
jgi:hypothetical protein